MSGKSRDNSMAATLGAEYVDCLETLYIPNKRSADLSAYFFFRATQLLRNNGAFGLVATNSISEGTSRAVALQPLLEAHGAIYRAVDSMPWPGTAAVLISIVHSYKGIWAAQCILNDQTVAGISSLLEPETNEACAYALSGRLHAYHGTKPRGNFFLESADTNTALSDASQPRQYLSGQDLNSSPTQAASRHILVFQASTEEEARSQNPALFELLRSQVYEYRRLTGVRRLMERWWEFEYPASDLYDAIEHHAGHMVFACCRVSNELMVVHVNRTHLFSDGTIVFLLDSWSGFAVIQSSLCHAWVRKFCATFKADMRMNVTDVFDTFPLPAGGTHGMILLNKAGEQYHCHRQAVMLEKSIGLTTTYNRFHALDEAANDITKLRDLHVEMDKAVAAAYGWDDLALDHGFHQTKQGLRFTISEPARREVLARLLKLNHERYAEEVAAGLHDKKKGKGYGSRNKRDGDTESRGPTLF
jgi:hypothetical protein